MSAKQTPLNIGLDLGMGACKITAPAGSVHLPAFVALADGRQFGRLAGMKGVKPPTSVTVDGRPFYVGDGAHGWGRPVENLDYDRLTGAPEMRAIVYAAIEAAYPGPKKPPLNLWIGMPLEPLSGDDAAQVAADVRAWLRGDHAYEIDGQPRELHVASCHITSQATGALFDYLLDDNGAFHTDRRGHAKEEIGIISIGFNTVELMAVQQTQIIPRFTAGTASGSRRLLDLVNGDGLYSLGELDALLRAGSLDTAAAVPLWAREVTGFVERTWGKSWKRFAKILVCGGGALLLNGHLKFNGRAHHPDQPVQAIARGLYKMALMKESRR